MANIVVLPIVYVDGQVLTASDLNTNLNTLNAATIPVANGGTGLTAGTSGGVLYYSATGTMGSSGALTAAAVVLGGGAGSAPTSLALGTANRVLGMNSGATAHEYKTVTAGTNISVTHTANAITIASTASGGSTFAGADTTERTTTATSLADLSTVTGLNIAAATPITIRFKFRKTTGAASACFFGLKINATEISAGENLTSGANQIETGAATIYIPPRDGTYVSAVLYLADNNPGGTGAPKSVRCAAASIPTVAVTSLTITGASGSALITTATDEMFIYTEAVA